MKVFLFLLIISCSSFLYAQENKDSTLAQAFAFEIGANLKDYKDLDRFVEMSRPNYYTYTFFAKEHDSIKLADLKFYMITVSTTKNEKITKVSYNKYYSSVDSNYLIPIFNRDFETLSNWLTNLFGMPYKTVSLHLTETRRYDESTSWRIKNRRITLIKSWAKIRGAENQIENRLELTVD